MLWSRIPTGVAASTSTGKEPVVPQMAIYVYLALAALAGGASLLTGWMWLPPFLQATLVFPVYLYFILNRWRGRAVAGMLLWALLTSIVTILITVSRPETAAGAVFNGAAYRDEMMAWIRTGVGAESTPAEFIPVHALHYGLFLAGSLLTLGWAGLVMGAVLLNYMNFYVGSLVLAAERPELAALFGWPPYAVIRVAGYIMGAVALSDFATAVVLRRNPWERSVTKRLLGLSVLFFVSDVLVKIVVAPWWRRLLAWIAGG
jgi:hypothetical protein